MAEVAWQIPMMVKPFEMPSPLDTAAKVMKLSDLLDKRDLRGLEADKLRGELSERDAYTSASREAGGNLTSLRDILMQRGSPSKALVVDKHIGESDQRRANIDKIQAEAAAKHLNVISSAFAPLASRQTVTPEDIAGAFEMINASGVPADRVNAFRAQLPQDPAMFPRYAQGIAAFTKDGIDRLKALSPEVVMQDTGGTIQPFNKNPLAGPIAPIPGAQSLVKTPSLKDLLADERVRSEGAANRGVQMRGQNMTDARGRELADIQRQTGRIPQGYRLNPTGELEPIPGGPAEIGKALPNPAINALGSAGAAVEDTRRLTSSFQPGYGGKTILGDMSNTLGRVMGDSTGQAQWWQDMDALQNRTRNELFGSALTATELAAWNKTSITPRMDPEQIRQNLQRRQEIEARAASKLARAYEAGGYNKTQIRELLGTGAQYLDQAAPPVNAVPSRRATDRQSIQRPPLSAFER
jgi:hypothetical protein